MIIEKKNAKDYIINEEVCNKVYNNLTKQNKMIKLKEIYLIYPQ